MFILNEREFPRSLRVRKSVDDVAVDIATDVPCMSADFIRKHSVLRHHNILPFPPGAITFRTADGSLLSMEGYMRFMLTIGETHAAS